MTMMDFFRKSEGTWLTLRAVHHFDLVEDESGESNLIVRVIEPVLSNTKTISSPDLRSSPMVWRNSPEPMPPAASPPVAAAVAPGRTMCGFSRSRSGCVVFGSGGGISATAGSISGTGSGGGSGGSMATSGGAGIGASDDGDALHHGQDRSCHAGSIDRFGNFTRALCAHDRRPQPGLHQLELGREEARELRLARAHLSDAVADETTIEVRCARHLLPDLEHALQILARRTGGREHVAQTRFEDVVHVAFDDSLEEIPLVSKRAVQALPAETRGLLQIRDAGACVAVLPERHERPIEHLVLVKIARATSHSGTRALFERPVNNGLGDSTRLGFRF